MLQRFSAVPGHDTASGQFACVACPAAGGNAGPVAVAPVAPKCRRIGAPTFVEVGVMGRGAGGWYLLCIPPPPLNRNRP